MDCLDIFSCSEEYVPFGLSHDIVFEGEDQTKAELVIMLACDMYADLNRDDIVRSARNASWTLQETVEFLTSRGVVAIQKFIADATFCYRAVKLVKCLRPYEFDRSRTLECAITLCDIIDDVYRRLVREGSIYASRLADLLLRSQIRDEDKETMASVFVSIVDEFDSRTGVDPADDFLVDASLQ